MKQANLRNWKFFLGDDPNAFQKDYADDTWQDVVVPHDWSITQDFTKNASSGTGYLPGGVAWYRCHFDLTELGDLEDKVLQIWFDGVYKNPDVWVNGYHLGYIASGYSSFKYDLTELASYNTDSQLVVAVRVDHTDIADSRWYNGSGITRPVTLAVMDSVYVDRHDVTFTTEEVKDDMAVVKTKVHLTNKASDPVAVQLVQTLTEVGGNQSVSLVDEMIQVAPEGQTKETITELKDVKLWSPESPALYELTTTIKQAGKETTRTEKVGIRTFVFDADNGFSLNHQPAVKLKGLCLHEDAGCFGTAVPSAVWLRRLLKLKEAGCNAIRMAHNPHSQVLYDLCDALGFFVFDEAFDEWENAKNKWWQGHNVYPPKYEGYAKDFPVWHEHDLVDMIKCNKNHASIIAWSIGNEIDYPNDPYANPMFTEMEGNNDANKPAEERIYNPNRPDTRRLTSIAKELSAIVNREDPTRPSTLAAAFPELSAHTGLVDTVDVTGYNYKEHLYEEHHQMFPKKPLLGSENRHGYAQWLAVKNNDYISGQFLWTGIDYLGESRGVWPKHGTYRGIIDMCGYENQMFYKRRSWWSEELTAKLYTRPYSGPVDELWELVFRKWNYRVGEEVQIRLYANTDDFTVKIGDAPVAMTFDENEGYYVGIVKYSDAPLTVVAKKDGVEATDKLEPVGAPRELTANVWQAPADHVAYDHSFETDKQVHQIELSFVDEVGRQTAAEEIVRFETADEAIKFLGFENGNVEDITNYGEHYRRSWKGKLICYVEAPKGHQGKVRFLADSFGPKEVTL